MNVIMCSVKEAVKLMEHMDDEDMVVLTIINREEKKYIHDIPKKIRKKNGEDLIKQADNIYYQNNDYFGRLSLYGVLKGRDIVHNISFPKMEQYTEQMF